jgi:hypothetical protein
MACRHRDPSLFSAWQISIVGQSPSPVRLDITSNLLE